MGFFDEYDWKLPILACVVALFLFALGQWLRQIYPPAFDLYANPEQEQQQAIDSRSGH